MRLGIGIAIAGIIALASVCFVPASHAQGIHFGIGEEHHGDWGHDRGRDWDHDRGWRDHDHDRWWWWRHHHHHHHDWD